MIFKYIYSDKSEKTLEFSTYSDAAWFAYCEGDHLIDWYKV